MDKDTGPSMEMRALLAIVLSMVVLTLYQYFFVPPPVEPPPVAGETAAGTTAPEDGQPRDPQVPEGGGEPELLSPAEPLAAAERTTVRIRADHYAAEVDNRGGVLASFVLFDYRDDDGEFVDLVHPAARAAGMLPLRLLSPGDPSVAEAANAGLHVVEVTGGRLDGREHIPLPDDPVVVTLQWGDERSSFRRELSFPAEGYQVRVSVDSASATGTWLALGPGLNPVNVDSRNVFLGETAPVYTPEGIEHWDAGDLEAAVPLEGYFRWAGLESHYFLAAFLLDRESALRLSSVALADPASAGVPEAEPLTLVETAIRVDPSTEIPVYFGPKKYDLLVDQGYGLRDAVDFGWFGIVARPLLALLLWIQGFVGNYGVAIILLTVLLRVVFLPLNHKAMVSMRRTQQLQPQMAAIRAKYKGATDLAKRQKMNEEVMELYRREGVSPFGGCLPMLAQLPILFAFYRLLSVAIELRGAPFVLWIQDLSKYDPYLVLPLLMGGSMILQQQMTPTAGVNPAQARMMRLMPVMFTVLFLYVPSGLVLYWLVNNVLGIAQQAYVNNRFAVAPASPSGPKSKKSQRGKR